MKKFLFGIFLLLAPFGALAQTNAEVTQSGTVTPSHLAVWLNTSVIADAGNSQNSLVSTLGITSPDPQSFCINDAQPPAAFHQFCLGIDPNTAAFITLNAFGGAPEIPLECNINGVISSCIGGGGGGNVTATGPAVLGDCFKSDGTASPYGATLATCGTGNVVASGAVTNGECAIFTGTLFNVIGGSCGSGSPGGTSGQIEWNNSGAFAGFTMSGDCTITTSTGVIICLTSNGVPIGNVSSSGSPTTGQCAIFTGSGFSVSPGACGSAGSIAGIFPGGRLTPTTLVPVQSNPVALSTQLFYDCYVNDTVPVYNGSSFLGLSIPSCEISLQLDTTNQVTGNVYDVFGFSNSGTLMLCVAGQAWATVNSRVTSMMYDITNAVGGILTNKFSIAHCFNGGTDFGTIAANQATYLGSIYQPAATAQLATTITSGDVSIPVVPDGCGTGTMCFPQMTTQEFYIIINDEIMLVTAGQSTSAWAVTRGQLGTTAATHEEGQFIHMANGQIICNLAHPQLILSTPLNGENQICTYFNNYNRVPFGLQSTPRATTFPASFAIFAQFPSIANEVTFLDGTATETYTTEAASSGQNNGSLYELIIDAQGITSQFHVSEAVGNTGGVAQLYVSQTWSPVMGLNTAYPAAETLTNGAVLQGFGQSYIDLQYTN
jgi:hypothetical protein